MTSRNVDDHPRERRVVEPVGDRHRLPMPLAVGVPHPSLDVGGPVGQLDHAGPRRAHRRHVVGMPVLAHHRAHELTGGIPRESLVRRARVQATPVGIDDHDAVGRVLDERSEARLGCRDARFGLAPVRDVVHIHDDPLDHGIVEVVRHRQLAPPHPTVAVTHAHVGGQGRARRPAQPVAVLGSHAFDVFGNHDDARVGAVRPALRRCIRSGCGSLRWRTRSCRWCRAPRPRRRRSSAADGSDLHCAQRGGRALAFGRAHPEDAHHEREADRHQRRDPGTLAGADDAWDPTERDTESARVRGTRCSRPSRGTRPKNPRARRTAQPRTRSRPRAPGPIQW